MLLNCVTGQLFNQNPDRDVDGQVLSRLLHLIADTLDENLDDLEVAEDVWRVTVEVA